MSKIFHRGWVYVGHASEVPQPGDFRVTTIGHQSIHRYVRTQQNDWLKG